MKQNETAIELTYGSEMLILPKSQRMYLIDLNLDSQLCVKGHEAVINEESLRRKIADCYEHVVRECMEKQEGHRVYGDIKKEDIESYIEKDLKERGNRFVLDQIFFHGYYNLKKDMVPCADKLYYCNDDIEASTIS